MSLQSANRQRGSASEMECHRVRRKLPHADDLSCRSDTTGPDDLFTILYEQPTALETVLDFSSCLGLIITSCKDGKNSRRRVQIQQKSLLDT